MVPSATGAGKDFSSHRKIAPRCGLSCTSRSQGVGTEASPSWRSREAGNSREVGSRRLSGRAGLQLPSPFTGLRAPLHVARDSSPRLAGRVECPLPPCFSFGSFQL